MHDGTCTACVPSPSVYSHTGAWVQDLTTNLVRQILFLQLVADPSWSFVARFAFTVSVTLVIFAGSLGFLESLNRILLLRVSFASRFSVGSRVGWVPWNVFSAKVTILRLLYLSFWCGRGFNVFVLFQSFFYGDTLILGFFLCFLTLNSLVMCEVFNIFRMSVGFICLCLWSRMKLLCSGNGIIQA